MATLILTAILAFPTASASAMRPIGEGSFTTEASTTTARQHARPKRVCRIDWRDGRQEVMALIRCAARHFDVSVSTALYVADRESNFQPRAFNSGSCAQGLFQHLCRYWPDRASDYGYRGWSAFNGRANVMVTMKMVRRYGWGPWSL
jgi:hypothetical protein